MIEMVADVSARKEQPGPCVRARGIMTWPGAASGISPLALSKTIAASAHHLVIYARNCFETVYWRAQAAMVFEGRLCGSNVLPRLRYSAERPRKNPHRRSL
ncbi:MAG: hypothetical protein EOO33_00760 [Comamonadaceae bacterium]|nr:MAG: hypothetical protein EOO33_00760 [Comamonadaceae bacterium]